MRPKYLSKSAGILWIALVLLAGACTDWNAGSAGGPWLQASGSAGLADAASGDAGSSSALGKGGGIVSWDTWKAPDAPVTKADGSSAGADAGLSADVSATADDSGTADSADAGGGADLAVVDIVDPDGAGSDGAASSDTADTSYSMDGKADFVGWPELPPPTPDAAAEDAAADEFDGEPTDASAVDTAQPDAGPPDAAEPDIFAPDVVLPEEVGADVIEIDVIEWDATPADVPGPDGVWPDAAGPDEISWDGAGPDIGEPDAWLPDAAPFDSGEPDAGGPDLAVADAMPDAPPDTSADGGVDSSLLDGAQVPDWQGYPDLPYAADADVYGGAIGSCLSMYLYQQELCGDSNPTAACINSMTADGSLFAQFQFEPLRLCETAVCTELCASATTKQCMESCVAKYCAAPFLACTSNGAQGPQSCSDAWKCSKQYPDKLLTISAKCYSAATAQAQQQFSAVIGCVSKPQTAGCIPEVSACFSAGAAATASCSSTLTCMNSCNSEEICGFTCLGQASPAAVQLIDAIWSCSLSVCTPKCAGSSDPACQDDCMKSECQSQLVQCLVN